jgi:hypothetical protein
VGEEWKGVSVRNIEPGDDSKSRFGNRGRGIFGEAQIVAWSSLARQWVFEGFVIYHSERQGFIQGLHIAIAAGK